MEEEFCPKNDGRIDPDDSCLNCHKYFRCPENE